MYVFINPIEKYEKKNEEKKLMLSLLNIKGLQLDSNPQPLSS